MMTDLLYRPIEEIRRVQFIRHAQSLGFTLEEIAELLALRVARTQNCVGVEQAARRTQQRVKTRLADLGRMDQVLGELIGACQRKQTTEACPILAALDEESTA